ncbi:hypothetical protein [uncultured Alistipes sp.]|uniref:hypothetical protein n=1 Tax=uncultured Alistipes sp. TaxID=538949 RepID=UPI00266EA701|nr:hypothetical protein [uncultured Alistipes sp.]
MKRFFTLCMVAAFALSIGCEKTPEEEMIWDFSPFSVSFSVSDAETGADLLDPDSERNILGQEIAVVYNGARYQVVLPESPDWGPKTRFLMPQPLALRLMRSYTLTEVNGEWRKIYGTYRLEFGEFTPVDDWHGQELTMEWGDGSTNAVRFDLYIKWKRVNDPEVLSPIWFDGVQQSDWHIALRK